MCSGRRLLCVAQILNARRRDDGSREFLVSFEDGADDEWVDEADVAPDVIEDWDAGVEYAVAREVVDIVQVGTERRFKVCTGFHTWAPHT
eukprot:355892-Chlamydomonas_euryale.AAC.7